MKQSPEPDTPKRDINDATKKRLTEKCLKEFEQHMQLVQDDLHMLYLLGHTVDTYISDTGTMSVNIISICRTGKSIV